MPHPRSKLPLQIVALALVGVIGSVYSAVYRFEFVHFDDQDYIYNNPQVLRGLNAQTIAWAFTTGDAANYHPLTWLSLLVDVSLFGLRPGYFHVENAVLHAANAVLLFVFLRKASGCDWPSAFVAFVFATHPAHVESVAWISERKNVLSTLFGLLAMLFYLRWIGCKSGRASAISYAGLLICFALSLLSKQMLVTLPFVFILLDYWPLQRGDRGWFRLIAEKIPLFLLAAAASVVVFFAQRWGGAMSSTTDVPIASRLENVVVAYARYVIDSFCPVNLCLFYPYQKDWPVWAIAGSLLLLGVITIFTFRERRRRPYLLVGWLWFLGTLVPVIGLVQIGSTSIADRYLYIPHIGLAIMVAWGATDIAIASDSRAVRRIVIGVGVAVIGSLAVAAHRQVAYWKDTRTIFAHTLSVLNDDESAHMQMANVELREGNRAAAFTEYQQAARMSPTDYRPEFDLGNLLLEFPDQAIPHYQRALILQPHQANVENNLGIALAKIHRADLAARQFQSAIADDPAYADPHANLGMLLESQSQPDAAAAEYAVALRIDPQNRIAAAGMLRLNPTRR